jgi:hypothetical protein
MISIQTNVPSIESPIDWILSQKERIAKGYYSFSELQVPGTKDAAERSVDGYLSEPYCSFGSFAISQSTKNNITHAPIRFGFRCPPTLHPLFFRVWLLPRGGSAVSSLKLWEKQGWWPSDIPLCHYMDGSLS